MGHNKHIQQTIDEHNQYQCPVCKQYSLFVTSADFAICHGRYCLGKVTSHEQILELLGSENYEGCFDPWEIMLG